MPAASGPLTAREPDRQDPSAAAARRRRLNVLGVVAVVLIGLNLRAGISSASALFHDLQLFLGYGPFVAALLPSIPTLVFAAAGAATSRMVRRAGLERTILIALLILTAGLAVRAVPAVGMLLLGTVLAMCGLALCNVAMPSFIREHYAHRTSSMTGLYTITMSVGATAASALSVPLARQLESPMLGLAAWAILAVAGVLVFLPIALAGSKAVKAPEVGHVPPFSLLRTRKGLLITGFFTTQAMLAYSMMSWLPLILITRGMSPEGAGVMLGVMQIVTVPASIILLAMGNKAGMLRASLSICSAAGVAGLLSLLFLPQSLALVAAIFLGIAFAVFPLILVVISRSGRDAAETTAMSTIAQSVGYLVATIGPFGMGLLFGLTGGWGLPLWLLLGIGLLQFMLGIWLTGKDREGKAA